MSRRPGWRAVAARACSLLLRYPDAEVLAFTPTLRGALAGLPRRVAQPLGALAAHRAGEAPSTLAAEYTGLFDLHRRSCLYLTYYTDGDTRKRGSALARFADGYRAAGLTIADGELPDYLPAVLDLAAHDDAGWALLTGCRVALTLLRAALAEQRSVYRHGITGVLALLPRSGPRELAAAARLAGSGPPQETVGVEPGGHPGGTA